MRRLFTALLLLLLTAAAAHARQQPAAGGARLVEAFGEIQTSDLLARLDNYAIEVQNDPAARAVVVVYAARHKFPGWPLRRGRFALNYLKDSRGIDAARLSLVNGGLRAEISFELWVVPAGAESPAKAFDAALLMSGERAAVPFDRFTVVERRDRVEVEIYERDPHPDDAYMYEYFAGVLRSDPSLRGCVIGYTSRRGSPAAGRRIASRAKLTMAKAYAIDVSRVAALGGGRREYKMLELWLVPPGAALPKPSPPAAGRFHLTK